MERHWKYIIIILIVISAIYLITYTTNVKLWSIKNKKDAGPKYLPHYMRVQNSTHLSRSRCSKLSNLRKVLLAINYNTPFYASIPILKQYYGDVFGKVIFCGGSENADVINFDEHRGYFGYDCLVRAIQRYPGFDGYFYINDDVLVNWWNFLEFDTSKIWLGAPVHFQTGHEMGQPVKTGWHWWKTAHAAKLCEKAFEKVEQLSKTRDGVRLGIPKYINRYFRNTRNQRLCVHSWADVLYVPRYLSKPFARILQIFRENNVFLEVAVPTVLSFFLEPANSLNAHGVYMNDLYGYSPKYLSGEAFYETYSVHVTFQHPFKLGGPMKIANYNFLRNVVSVFGENVKYYCTWKKKVSNSLN